MGINQYALVIFRRANALRIMSLMTLLLGLLSFLLFAPFSPTVSAVTTVPTKMNFQGRLTDASGTVKPTGSYNMRLKLYTVSSGGAAVWSEDRLVSATQGVAVTNGQFSIQLGDITSLPASLFASGPLYLEVELPTPATATTSSPTWTEGAMTPRNQMATSAYAYNAETLDGLDSAAFGLLGGNNIWTGTNDFNGFSFSAVAEDAITINAGSDMSIGGYNTDVAGSSYLGLSAPTMQVFSTDLNLFTSSINAEVTSRTVFTFNELAPELFSINASSYDVRVGDANGDNDPVMFIIDTKTGSGDPIGTVGSIYYNSNSGRYRCYQSAAWKNCDDGGDATTVDGVDSTAFAQLSANNTFSGTAAFNGSTFAIGGAANAAKFNVASLFNVDSSTSKVTIGASDTTGSVFVLDTKTNAGDPTGLAGAMYYNSNDGKFRCYQGAAWTDCIGAGGSTDLQTAYTNSTSPATITTTAAKGVKIAAGAVPTSPLLTVDNTGFGVTTANTPGVNVMYTGGAAAVEGAGVRVDLTPGTTTGGTWSGLRVVANATGAVSGVTEYGIKLEGPGTPGAGTETGMYIGTGWDTGLDVQSGGLNLAGYTSGGNPSDPAAPAAGNLRVYAKSVAGRMMLKWIAPSGVDTSLQTSIGFNTIHLWTPATGTTAVGTGFGTTWPAATGTVTHPTVTNTNLSNSVKAMQLANVVTTPNQALGVAAITATNQNFWRGNAAGLGGFFMQTRFKTALVPAATHRTFVGLTSMTSAAVVADTVTGDTAGLSHITTDSATTMAFMTRDNVTTNRATFTVPTIASGNIYDFTMYAPPNGSVIYYRLVNLSDGSVIVDSSSNTNLPRNNVFMGPQVQMSNGAANIVANTTAIAINKIYIETDN